MSQADRTATGLRLQTSSCPTDLELARLVECTLSVDAAAAALLAHLADCDDCREVVAMMVGGFAASGLHCRVGERWAPPTPGSHDR